eukprot:8693338-Alexandrium_andersonii.AAC.1
MEPLDGSCCRAMRSAQVGEKLRDKFQGGDKMKIIMNMLNWRLKQAEMEKAEARLRERKFNPYA